MPTGLETSHTPDIQQYIRPHTWSYTAIPPTVLVELSTDGGPGTQAMLGARTFADVTGAAVAHKDIQALALVRVAQRAQ